MSSQGVLSEHKSENLLYKSLTFLSKAVLFSFYLTSAMCIILILIILSSKGFDITDEGLYLTSLQHPQDVKAIVTFAHVYAHFLYKFALSNLALFRAAGIIIMVILSSLLTIVTFRNTPYKARTINLIPFVFVAMGSSCSFYFFYIFTPHYNWQNSIILTTLSICLITLLYTQNIKLKSILSFCMGFILGFSWFIKPSTFILTLPLITTILFVYKKSAYVYFLMLFGLIFSFVINFTLFIDKNTYYTTLLYGTESLIILGAHLKSTLLSNFILLINFLKSIILTSLLSIKIIEIFHILLFSYFIAPYFKIDFIKIKYFNELLFITALIVLFSISIFYSPDQLFKNLFIIYLSIIIFLLHILFWKKNIEPFNTRLICLIAFLGLLPVAGVFGTSSAFKIGIVRGGFIVYYTIISFILLNYIKNNILTQSYLVFISLLNLLTLVQAIYHPYRLNTNYLKQTIPIEIGSPASIINIDLETKEAIDKFKAILVAHSFKRGSDMIGFARLNGLAFAVGARSPGTPWYVSRYPGSKAYNTFGLHLVPKTRLKKAWILISDNDLEAVPNFEEVGISFNSQYKKIGQVAWPYTRSLIHIYKPANL